jgi:hypothetical protein
MIGMIKSGSSFYHVINYVLEDKKELTEALKREMSLKDGVSHKDRAEVLAYHKCFGDKYELTEQFKEVASLSKRCEKPVFHMTVRLAPGDRLSRGQLIALGEDLTKEFGVSENQYLMVYHKDTKQPHIHIVANRVGLNGRAASDSNSYKRMAAFCRHQEKKFGLKEVLSPRQFLSGRERLLPRQDQRKLKLADDIRQTLQAAGSYREFESRMRELGYQVIKGRGIAFIDPKRVRIKGSEAGFPLSKIEKILALKQQLRQAELVKRGHKERNLTSMARRQHPQETVRQSVTSAAVMIEKTISGVSSMIEDLLTPIPGGDHVPYELSQEAYERRQKKKRRRPS